MDTKKETNKEHNMIHVQVAESDVARVPASEDPKEQKPVLSGRALQRQKKLRFQPEDVKFHDAGSHHQYYKEVGGAEMKEDELPRAICVADKIEASVKEMKSMLRAVAQHTGGRTLLQKLPRHMRRRAASHNRKRLPRRLHQLTKEMEKSKDGDGDADKPIQKVTRKKRRRKHNLQVEYAKRAGKQGWLETHLWHAKRFHMSETTDEKFSKWGNRVALHPNDKSFRACYRAVAKHCLIQDISYLSCIRLCGRQDILIHAMKGISNHTFTPEELNGWIEANILICHVPDENTTQCVGPASVIWNATFTDRSQELLLWLHPIVLSETCHLLEEILSKCNNEFEIRDVSGELLRFRLTGPKASITLLSVLRPLNVVPEKSKDTDIAKWMEKEKMTILQLHDDFVSQATDCHRDKFAREKTSFDYCPDGGVFPVITDDPRLVLPINKTTPTLTKVRGLKSCSNIRFIWYEFFFGLPDEIDEALACDSELELSNSMQNAKTSMSEQPKHACASPLWCDTIREQVSCSREADHIVSTRRRQMKAIEDSDAQKKAWRDHLSTPVPVIAIRKVPNIENRKEQTDPSYQKSDHSGPGRSFTSGWDLIIPKKWGTAFWIPLIYHRARPGGLRENQSISLEALRPHFPEDFPDTLSGSKWWDAESKALCSKHYKRPPAKRTNYSVAAIQSPFKPDWTALFRTSTPGNSEVGMGSVNNCEPPAKRLKLSELPETVAISETATIEGEESQIVGSSNQIAIDDTDSLINKISVLRVKEVISQLDSWMKCLLDPNLSMKKNNPSEFPDINFHDSMLVCVGVQALSKGVPDARATLNFPTEQDFNDLCSEMTDPYKYGLVSVSGPVEEKHWDPYRKERKEARKLKKLRKKAKKKDASGKTAEVELLPNLVENQTHFPVAPSRETIGYVTSGRFLYSHACGAGVGFITLASLRRLCLFQVGHQQLGQLFRNSSDFRGAPLLALVRNVDSTQYRFVKLKLVKPW